MDIKLSAQEIETLQKEAKLASIPNSGLGIAKRAKKELWSVSVVKGKGGKGGIKTLYTLPDYVMQEIEERNLIHLFVDKDTNEVGQEQQLLPLKVKYKTWAKSLDVSAVAPVVFDPDIYMRMDPAHICLNAKTEFIPFGKKFLQGLGVEAENLLCIPVQGNSMFPTLIHDGIALFDVSKKYDGENIYLIRHVGELKIRRLQMLTHLKIRIICDNKNVYEAMDIELHKVDSSNFEIMGKYVWHGGVAK